ncbi:MAG TPA: hypothetical protein ENF41_02955 [Candidatus Bathyarchaeota archaeon]|nr:hypothetical protein [Candidatus Bathyarchaeota archaeon]
MEEAMRVYREYRELKKKLKLERESYPLDPQKIIEDLSIDKLLLGADGVKREKLVVKLGGWI